VIKKTTLKYNLENSKTKNTITKYQNSDDKNPNDKNKNTAILFSCPLLIMGLFGVYDFYLGYTGNGVMHVILLSLLIGAFIFFNPNTFTGIIYLLIGLISLLIDIIWTTADFLNICLDYIYPNDGHWIDKHNPYSVSNSF
jgi:TM2 domain-containing membrane protein YozV